MNKSIIIIFLYLVLSISISLGKSSKSKNKDEALEIISYSSNDNLPIYYEITIKGHFSNNKTGLTVTYLGSKVHDFILTKGELPTSTPTASTPKPTATPNPTLKPDKLIEASTDTTPLPTQKPTTTPTPTTPTPTPTTSKPLDTISFNITNFKDISTGSIEVSYKSGLNSNIDFVPTSIIKTVNRCDNVGGVVELKGTFFFTNKLKSNVLIGNQTCEVLTFDQTSIRCYLTKGSGCGHLIEIDNLFNFNNSTYFCYSNPVIQNIYGYKDKSSTRITITGKNFLLSANVTIEKPNGHKRDCDKVIVSTDTLYICELGSSYNKNVTIPTGTHSNYTILTFTNNSPNSTTITSNNNMDMISGNFQIKTSTVKPNTDDKKVVIDSSVENSIGGNTSPNSKSLDKTKLYLLIIIPSVLFIIVVALVAIFIKTRVITTNNSKKTKKDENGSSIPFQMLDDDSNNT